MTATYNIVAVARLRSQQLYQPKTPSPVAYLGFAQRGPPRAKLQ